MGVFVFCWAYHVECAVAAFGVVELFDVVVDGSGEFDAGGPTLAVEELDLHASPEGFDHGVVVWAADRAAGHELRSVRLPVGSLSCRRAWGWTVNHKRVERI